MPGPAGRTLTIVAESRAGLPTTHTLNDYEAIRISTGGAIPAGATAVIPQENVDAQDGTITTRTATNLGDHVRGRGEDMRAGATVLKAGTVAGRRRTGRGGVGRRHRTDRGPPAKGPGAVHGR